MAQFAVPRAEAQLATLETIERQLLAQGQGADCLGVVLAQFGHRGGNAAHGHPGGEIAVVHPALGVGLEAFLQLRGTEGFHGLVPGSRDQALGAGHRARVPGVVGQVLAEVATLVGHQHHVVFRRLGEQRHFRLGAAALVVVEAPWLLGDDLVAEAFGGALECVGVGNVVLGAAGHQQPARPFAHGEKLRQGIGEHGAAGQGVQHIVQALALAQAVVGAAGIEQQAVGQRLAELAQGCCRRIDHEQAQALCVQFMGCSQQVVVVAAFGYVELVTVVEKTPSAVAVDNRQLGPAQAGIGRLGDDVGQHRAGCRGVTQVADAHLQGVGCRAGQAGRCQAAQRGGAEHEGVADPTHGQLLDRCCQHRNSPVFGKYAQSTSTPVPR